MPCSLKAEYTLIDGRLCPDVVVRIGSDGLIEDVETTCRGEVPPSHRDPFSDDYRPPERVQRLRGKVLLPGFVNGHSHAFQRLLRGRTEHTPRGVSGDDFWSWRTAMYRAAHTLDPEQLQTVTTFAYVEMLRAGFTHVAEFHYLHHQADGTPYDDPLELTRRVIESADQVGIGLTLLRVAYQRGGADVPLALEQRRFVDGSIDAYARNVADTVALANEEHRHPVLAGLAAHSVRALDRDWLSALVEIAGDNPLHAHVAEQPREIEQCVAEHGLRPVSLLSELGYLKPGFTAVHATHLDPTDIRLLGEAGVTCCICPTTERNLGDGLPPLRELLDAGARLAIGSDSHAVIDPFREVASLENGERLRTGRRNVLTASAGPDGGVATTLLQAGARGGADSVGLNAGAIAPGMRGDLVALDLDDPALAGIQVGAHGSAALLGAIALAGGAHLVSDVWVGGKQMVVDGVHLRWESALRDYQQVAADLWA